MTDEKKQHPEGTKKREYITVESVKLNAKIKTAEGKPIGKTGLGVKLIYKNRFGTKTIQLPEGKFKEAALKVPDNKNLWAGLQEIEDDDEATLTQVKKNGYWEPINIEKGHVGGEGILDENGELPVKSGGSFNSWPEKENQIIAGQLINIAVSFVSSVATKANPPTWEQVEETALSIVEGYHQTKGKLSALLNAETKPSKPVKTSDSKSEDLEEEDDDASSSIDDDDDDVF